MGCGSALLIIDVQNDFCEGGSLAVPDGISVVGPINKLVKSRDWELVIASKDWHPSNHISFAASHPGKEPFQEYEIANDNSTSQFKSTLWPIHCVANTKGADIVQGLDMSQVNAIINKGENPSREFYSAFEDVLKQDQTRLLPLLKEHEIREVVIVGLAYDFCVLNTALDARAHGFDTTIVLECTRAISESGFHAATDRLLNAGVKLQS